MERPARLSFRISEQMRDQLARTARMMGESWGRIVRKALMEYLDRVDRQALAEEARRQSRLASGVVTPDEAIWENAVSDAGWR